MDSPPDNLQGSVPSASNASPNEIGNTRRSRWRLLGLALVLAVLADFSVAYLLRPADIVPESVLLPKISSLTELRSLALLHPENPEIALALAKSYLKYQHYLSAKSAFDNAIKDRADEWESLSGRVTACKALERFDLAEADINRLIEMRPSRIETYLALAEVCEQAGDNSAARRALKRIPIGQDGLPQTSGDRFMAADFLATAYSQLGDWKTALSILQKCLDQKPARLASRVEKGRALFALGRYAEAVPLLEAGAANAPRISNVQFVLGSAYLKRSHRGDMDRAFRCFQTASLADQTNGGAILAFAMECDRRKFKAAAAYAYQRAADLGMDGGAPLLRSGDLLLAVGNKEEGWYRRGRYYELSGNTSKALEEYKKLTTLHSCCRSGFLHLARVYSARQQSDLAISCILKAWQLDLNRAKQLRWVLATTYGDAHREKKEVALLQELISENGKESAQACYEMSAITKASGRLDDSEKWVRKSIALSPGESDYYTELGVLLLERRSHKENLISSIQNLETAIRLSPTNYRAVYNLGLAYSYSSRWAEAVLTLRHAVDLQPARGSGYHALALALQRTGAKDEGKEMENIFHRYEKYAHAREVLTARSDHAPRNAAAQRDMAEFHYHAGEYLAAIECYQQLLALQPQNREARVRLAESYGTLGRLQEQRAQLAILAGSIPKKLISAALKPDRVSND